MGADDPKEYSELVALWPNMPEQVEPFEFQDDDVPSALRALIPYARIWGIPDDGYRSDMLQQTPASVRAHLKRVVISKDEELTAWGTELEAQNSKIPAAYDAFVALLMAAVSV